jgi:EmrB/QacA subfamily drug resistance transporter
VEEEFRFRYAPAEPELRFMLPHRQELDQMTEAATPERRRWLVLALLAAAQFVVVLDASIVNVALPSIGSDLQFSQDNLSWVVNAYTLFFGGFLLLGGRLADLLGRRLIFMAGLVLFAVASLAGGLATTDIQLIAARAVQGLGAAMLSPAALSIVTTTFTEGAERNKALGVWGAVAGSGGAAGVLLGGVLTDALSWEWVLFVNVPIGVIAAALAPVLISESRSDSEHRAFDFAGAVTVTAGLSTLVYALVDAESAGWGSTQTVGLLALAVALLGAFIAIESRTKGPLLPLGIFRLRTLSASNVVGLLIGMSLFSTFFFMSLYMQQVLGYDALKSGLSYLPLALSIIVIAGVASQLVTRIGFKPVLMAGMLVIAGGLLWLAQVPPDGGYLEHLFGPMIVVGVGLGLAFVSVTIGAVAGTQPNEAGLASGIINTAQQVGGALGLAVLSTVAFANVPEGRPDPVALTNGFSDAFLLGAGFALLGFLVALFAVRSADSRAMREAEVVPVAA